MRSSPTWCRFGLLVVTCVLLLATGCGLRKRPQPLNTPLSANAVALSVLVSHRGAAIKIELASWAASRVHELRLLCREPARQQLSDVIAVFPVRGNALRFHYVEPPSRLGKRRSYRVALVRRGERSAPVLSDALDLNVGRLLPALAPVTVVVINDLVRVQWTHPAGFAQVGVELQRRAGRGKWVRLSDELLRRNEFVDLSAASDRSYHYRARLVSRRGAVQLVGPYSRETVVKIEDTTPPYPPLNFRLHVSAAGPWLSWDAVQEKSLLGYHLYRRRLPDGRWTRLTKRPIRSTMYHVKIRAFVGLTAFVVTAVDASRRRNESRHSQVLTLMSGMDPRFWW